MQWLLVSDQIFVPERLELKQLKMRSNHRLHAGHGSQLSDKRRSHMHLMKVLDLHELIQRTQKPAANKYCAHQKG